MYGTHTLAFQRIFVRMKIIALIFIRFSYVSLIRNSVTGPLRIVHSKNLMPLGIGAIMGSTPSSLYTLTSNSIQARDIMSRSQYWKGLGLNHKRLLHLSDTRVFS